MKGLIQRVANAKVTVNDEVISSIEQGLCVLVGISNNDTRKDMEYIVRKILSIRIFEDGSGKKWNKSVVDKDYEILCVSQFTLYNTWKGNKPDFHHAMPGDSSKEFYDNFLQMLKDAYKAEKVKDTMTLWFEDNISLVTHGLFGAFMQVHIQNDGPVTFELESPANLPEIKERRSNAKKEDSKSESHVDTQ